jgi:hypothetical protein
MGYQLMETHSIKGLVNVFSSFLGVFDGFVIERMIEYERLDGKWKWALREAQ